jgi:superfamily II DNA or RNA helicase
VDDGYERLFSAIRKKATPQVWSSGVTLARENKIVKEAEDEDSIAFVVLAGGRGKSLEVQLFPEDLDWQCDCQSQAEVCEHVAAAIITARTHEKSGEAVPTYRPELARLVYRLSVEDGLLVFERMRSQDGTHEVPHPILLGERATPGLPTIVQAPGDLEVDLAMGTWRRGRVPKSDMPKLIAALVKCGGRVTLSGADIQVATRPVVPQLVVEDAGRGFLARLAPDPEVQEVFRNGAALAGGVLRPVDDQAGIPEGERRPLERGRAFSAGEAPELLQLMQRLEKCVPVRVTSQRLPRGEVEPPHLVLDTENDDDRLSVLATLVYGDPPIARIDRGGMTILDAAEAVPLRDEREEQRLAQRLFGGLGLEIGRRVTFEGQDAVSFAQRLDAFQRGANRDLLTVRGEAWEDFTLQGGPLAGKVAIDAEGRFDLRFVTPDGDEADPVRVMKAWSRGWSVAPLPDGGFAPLPAQWLKAYGPLIANLLAAKGDREALPPAAVGDVVRLTEALGQPLPPRFERLRALIGDFSALPAPRLPRDLAAELRPYQKEGVAWLEFHRQAGIGALLADDMGLGKTLQALCAVEGRTLVVAPTSVLHGWAKEAARFRPLLKVAVYHGPQRKLDPSADLTLTTWAILRLDAEELVKVPWQTVVLDEAQIIKNPDAQVAKAAHRLRAGFRVCLSGTPVENRLEDLWSQMAFLEPGFLGAREAFMERYAAPIAGGDALRAQELRQRMRPFLLRRMKREVAPDLPPRTELVERCELEGEERVLYDALRAAAQREVMEELARGGNVLQALELLLRLRQAACHRGLVPGQDELEEQGRVETSAKLELLMELLDELVAEGHKVLVFSQWTTLLDRVEPHLATAGMTFLRLDGSTPDRQAVVDGFQSESGPPVLLLSLKAGGTGLTLTAADHVILLDPWWNPAVEDQAADRAHRIGQTKPVFIHRLVAADTVEERILALQESKRRLAEAALGEGAGGAGLTRDDLLALLS